jgi:ribosomal protein L21E
MGMGPGFDMRNWRNILSWKQDLELKVGDHVRVTGDRDILDGISASRVAGREGVVTGVDGSTWAVTIDGRIWFFPTILWKMFLEIIS